MKLFTRTLLLAILLSASAISARAQLVANFTTDVITGCAPLVVHFTNTTSPTTGTTYDWVGVGTGVLHLVDVSGTYLTPGSYTVTLTAHNGGSTSTHSVVITVLPSPTVSFTADDTSVCPGSTVTFTSTTIGGVPGAITCTWNFGDGGSATGNPVTHTYPTPGYYNVTLSATNSAGCVASLTKPSYIHVFDPPIPNFSAPTTWFCGTPGHAVFTSLPTGAGPFTYKWYFGDGFTSTLANPTHDYTAFGTYSVKLVITDSHGCMDSLTVPNYITVANLNAEFTFPSTACINTVVTFPNTSSSHISSQWWYGDLGTGTTETGSHIYTVAGTYIVKLVVFDGHCYDTVTHSIIIQPGPVASFTQTPIHPCPPPVALSFAATVPPGTGVTWVFGDWTGGTGLTPTHTYYHRGVYKIQMICVGTSGCIDTVTRIDTLYDLDFGITATPRSGCKPLTVNFNHYAYTYEPAPDTVTPRPYPYGISSYSWDYGDGSGLGTGGAPSHTYTAVGVYTVTCTATTGNGCVVTDTVLIYVGAPPVVHFTASPLHLCYHNNLVDFFTTIISGPVDHYYWEWGDGGTLDDTTGHPHHHYAYPGLFSVTLTPSYNGCLGPKYVMTNYITIDSPMSIISQVVLCSPAKRVVFGDSSMGDDTHMWIFGDGTTSTVNNPIHDYPLPITYNITLATYNAASGCRDTSFSSVNLSRPIPDFSAGDTAICRDSIVVLTASVTGGTASWYHWTTWGGRSADSNSSVAIDTFHTTGIYKVRLIIQDQNGCYDTTIKNNYILVAKPVAHFTVAPPSGCWPLTATFTDNSTDVPGTFFTNFRWAFGDGGTATTTSISTVHTFTSSGTFNTQEIVTDNVGCKDTVILPLVTVYRPTASFFAANTHPCVGDSILFSNTSVGITGSFWIFGDGGTSTLNSPWHTYTTSGIYTVKLVVTDSHGCPDTATYVSYINVTRPNASFYMDDSVSICPPLMVHFFNTSTGGIFYNWSLGDGSYSTAPNPSDLYISTGYDTVRLVVTNMYGCKDTAYGHINIFGYTGGFSYAPLTGCSPLKVNFYATTSNVPSIIWDFADGNTSAVSMTDTISHYYLIPGAYVPKLVLSDNTGCQNSSLGIDTIKVDAVTPMFVTDPNPICLGMTVSFIDSSKSYWSNITGWNWTYDGITSTAPSPSVTYTAVGTYPVTLQVTDGWGCIGVITKDVTVYAPPVIDAGPDTIVCVTDAATLIGTGGVSYVWGPAGTLSCTSCNPAYATPTVVTTYTVIGTDEHGCKNWDTVTVSLKTNTVSVARGDTQACFGIPVPLYDSGGTKYTWLPTAGLSNPHIANPIATPDITTTYMAIAQLGSCIPDTQYVKVIVFPLPTVDAGPSQTLLAGSTAQLNAVGTNIDRYKWTPGATLSCDTCFDPVASMSVSTTYMILVTTIHGCVNSDTVRILLFCDNSQLFIPNSFTPNGDGQNDIFYPRGQGVSIIKSFRIYNRWGQMLFERSGINLNDASNAWDGSFQGAAPKPDVYVYIIDAVCETGEPLFLKGDVTIIR
jgi:gliding motility-associated-like protein